MPAPIPREIQVSFFQSERTLGQGQVQDHLPISEMKAYFLFQLGECHSALTMGHIPEIWIENVGFFYNLYF